MTYFPTDWRLLSWALGSVVDTSGPISSHVISTTNSASGNAFTSGTKNPFMSLTLQEAQKGAATGQNFLRTIGGCIVDSMTINMAQNEIISCTVDLIGQSGTFSSGAITVPTNPGPNTKPFLWQDVQVFIPSGTVLSDVTNCTIGINNNLEAPHYLTGSRVIEAPIPLNRDLTLNIGLHATSEQTNTLYNQYFLGGSTFNCTVQVIQNAGSRSWYFFMSGCKMMDMSAPTSFEGVNTQTLTIRPQTISAAGSDQVVPYGAW